MKLKIVLLSCMLFNLFGGAYALETDLAFHTEPIPIGRQISAHLVWDTIRREVKDSRYRFKNFEVIGADDAPAWVDENVGDGELDLIFIFFPIALPRGLRDGVFQRFLDDGNMAVTYGFITQHTAEELKQFAADNEGRSVEGPESKITPMGLKFTPSLKALYRLTKEVDFENKVVDPKTLAPDWYLEVAFAQTANKDGLVDNAVFRNRRTNGRIAVFFQNRPVTPWGVDRAHDIIQGQANVFSEFIQNWIHKVASIRPQGRLTTTWGRMKQQ